VGEGLRPDGGVEEQGVAAGGAVGAAEAAVVLGDGVGHARGRDGHGALDEGVEDGGPVLGEQGAVTYGRLRMGPRKAAGSLSGPLPRATAEAAAGRPRW